jgi:DNA-directed RNA polymerase subunit H (RpoH/RPB5)
MFIYPNNIIKTESNTEYEKKAVKVLSEMMIDRGYIEDHPLQFKKEQDTIHIFFCIDSKLNIEIMKLVVCHLQDKKIPHAIIVHTDIITSSTKKLIEHLWDLDIETFHIDELQFNITHHTLFSKHELVSKTDENSLKPFLKKLPIILKTDPVVRYFHFNKHDILRIYRKDSSISYRVVH